MTARRLSLVGMIVSVLFLVLVEMAVGQGPVLKERSILLYDGSQKGMNNIPEAGEMWRTTRPITASVTQRTAGGVTVDTGADEAILSTYAAWVPELNHRYGYTLTLKYNSETMYDGWPEEGLTLVVTSQDGAEYRSLYLIFWQNGIRYRDDYLIGLGYSFDEPEKDYQIVVRPTAIDAGSSLLIDYEYTIYEDGWELLRERLPDYSVVKPYAGYDMGIDPFTWGGWLELGDTTTRRPVEFEFEYLRVDYGVRQEPIWLPVVGK